MAIKVPFRKASDTVKNLAGIIKILHYEVETKAEEKRFIELIVDRGPLGHDHYYIPVDQDNLVELADIEDLTQIVGEFRMKAVKKE